MASRSVCHDLPNQLTTLLRFGVVGDLSDGQLVQRFLTARDGADQAAFTALVERHGPMVLGVCREVLGNAQDAEDAFQATFLVLARKAGSVRKADSLAGWLHRVARRVAMQAKAEAARRRVYERRSAAMKAVQLERQEGSPEGWPELHEAIARLPERYREPVVLCYLEGLTTEEAAMRIGCPHGTILSRLSRARERLRGQLERRSLASPTALLTTGLKHRPMEALPAGLLDTTVRAAIGFAGRQTSEAGLASASATILAKGVLRTMAISKLKILVAMALACGFACGGAHVRADWRLRQPAARSYRRDSRAAPSGAGPFDEQAPIRAGRVGPAKHRDPKGAPRHPCRAGGIACRPAAAPCHEGRKPARPSDPCRFGPGGEPPRRGAEAPSRDAQRLCTILLSDLHDGSCRGRDDHHRRRTGTGFQQLWYGQVVA